MKSENSKVPKKSTTKKVATDTKETKAKTTKTTKTSTSTAKKTATKKVEDKETKEVATVKTTKARAATKKEEPKVETKETTKTSTKKTKTTSEPTKAEEPKKTTKRTTKKTTTKETEVKVVEAVKEEPKVEIPIMATPVEEPKVEISKEPVVIRTIPEKTPQDAIDSAHAAVARVDLAFKDVANTVSVIYDGYRVTNNGKIIGSFRKCIVRTDSMDFFNDITFALHNRFQAFDQKLFNKAIDILDTSPSRFDVII